MKILRFLGLALVLAALAYGAWRFKAWTDRPALLEVVVLECEDVRRVLALTGRVRPEKSNQLVPAVRARLLELGREEGEPVQVGDVLARLDDRRARADVARAKSALRRDREELAQLERDLERALSLAAEALLPAADLEAARLDVARMERRIEEGVEVVAELTARLDDYVLTSPIDGYVVERPVDPGQVVGPQDVLYELATAEDPEVEIEVDERYLAELELGQAARVAPLGGASESWPAEVIYIGRRIDRLSGAVIVRLAFPEQAPDLPVGLTLDVNLAVAEHPDALTVPRASVAGLGGETWVVTVEEGVTARREVEVLDWPAPRLVVRTGLEAGEQVARDPRQVGVGSEVRVELTVPSGGAP